MIIFKKATLEDLDKVIIGIMQLKDTDTCVTTVEAMEFIDHCYYAEDDASNYIVGIVAATREVLQEYSEVEDSVVTTYPNKYNIVYMLGDDYFIEEYNKQTLQDIMVYLVRELSADMNDWSVWADTSKIFTTDDKFNNAIAIALRTNDFVKSKSHDNMYIRVMPLQFNKNH